jgi:hypothetical protein
MLVALGTLYVVVETGRSVMPVVFVDALGAVAAQPVLMPARYAATVWAACRSRLALAMS